MNAAPLSPGRKLGRAVGALICLLLLALVVAALWWRFIAQPGLIFGAVVDGQRGVLTARADGQVIEVRAAPDQVVSVGQPLLFLALLPDPGMAADTREALEAMRERVTAGERAEKEARAEVERASLEHARRQLALRGAGQAASGGEASRQEQERLRAEERRAAAALEAAKNRAEALSLARQSVENAYRQMREAVRRQTEGRAAEPEQMAVVAPSAGKISMLDAKPGMRVRSGQTLAVIEPVLPEQIWVVGFVKPANLTRLRPDKVFALRFPGHSQRLTGQVDAIQENPPQSDLPGVPVRLRLNGYDPLTMPALVIGQKVDVQEQ